MNGLTQTQQYLLNILSCALFDKDLDLNEKNIDWQELKKEAIDQAVYTIVFPVIKGMLPDEYSSEWNKQYVRLRARNMKNDFEHTELHELMTEYNIPYTVLKGFSSAYYYPDPFDRMMGDVDFLVSDNDIEAAGKALESIGFERENHEKVAHHNEYYRGKSIWELHYTIGGIPNGMQGEKIKQCVSEFIESSEVVEYSSVTCRIPKANDHCLTMIVHIAKHIMGGEGIGLRHLCDWAVFVDKIDISDYRELLENTGLWLFACQLTAVCSRYLRSKEYPWCENISKEFTAQFVVDIVNAGNFGCKEDNHGTGYRIVKKNNVFRSLASRAKDYYPFCRDNKLLVPLGVVMLVFVFLGRRISGEKKWVKLSSIQDGLNRKKLYEQFHLYE